MASPTTQSALSTSTHLQTLLTHHGPPTSTTLPSPPSITTALTTIHTHLPATGLGQDLTAAHLLQEITPGLSRSSLSPHYYGFVTGGHTPISLFADHIVSVWDQNVSVHLPAESVATVVEERALRMVCQLFGLDGARFGARTLTTGATASNVLGLAAGREFVLRAWSERVGVGYDAARGLLESCLRAGVRKVQVLTTMPHSSLGKAASVVGLGSGSLVDVSVRNADGSLGIKFDLERLEALLAEPHSASIVAISCSEVNQGAFATSSLEEMRHLRFLCDKYNAWIHVDAAFGIFATLLPSTPEFHTLHTNTAGLHLADSITSDGHKLLNVPYDTGIFLCRHASLVETTFSNPNAPYLRSTADDGITSPLNVGLENSRRWRALPVYANLVAYGRAGYADMIERMVRLARGVARWILLECPWLELLLPPGSDMSGSADNDISVCLQSIFIVIAFRHRDAVQNESLVQRIKADGRIYVSGTVLGGRAAARIAVAKWDVDVERDLALVREVLVAVK